MSDTRTNDELRALRRQVEELRTAMARMPIERGKVNPRIRVYEFRNCERPELVLYIDNPEVASHVEGGANEDKPVALIDIDGIIDCWELIGPMSHCKTGQCALILGWAEKCEDCQRCFLLWPCPSGSPLYVRGNEWIEYIDRIVLIDVGSGPECRRVEQSSECVDDIEDLSVDDIVADYSSCDDCAGCYELTNCADSTTKWVSDDLGGILGLDPLEDLVGNATVLRIAGVCWEVTDFVTPCVESAVSLGLFSPSQILVLDSCEDCGCFELIPCPDQAGSPTSFKVKLEDGDYDLTELINSDGSSNGKVIMLAGHVCYTVRRPESCDGAFIGLGTVYEVFDSCDDCEITCWNECGTSNYIRTYSDMSAYKRSGVALKRAEDGLCYEYESSLGACGEPAIVEFTIEEVYEHATDACAICQDPRYKLTPACTASCTGCEGGSGSGGDSGGDVIVSDDETLNDAVGRYVKANGRCYLVELTTDSLSGTLDCWQGPFDNCAACGGTATRLTVITKRGDAFYATEIEGAFVVCSETAIGTPCPTPP